MSPEIFTGNSRPAFKPLYCSDTNTAHCSPLSLFTEIFWEFMSSSNIYKHGFWFKQWQH